jgi:hypothetical protein
MTLWRQLLAKARGTEDRADLPFRYAENRRTRVPTIFRPDVDPDQSIKNATQYMQGRVTDSMLGLAPPPEDEEEEKEQILKRLRVAGTYMPYGDPLKALRIARDEAPPLGPSTVEAYDQMEGILRKRPRIHPRNRGAGVIEVSADTAEEANPNTLRHEEGHAAIQPVLSQLVKEAEKRFGVGRDGTAEALAYGYEGVEDPTGLTPIIEPLLQGLYPRLGQPGKDVIDRYRKGRWRPK